MMDDVLIILTTCLPYHVNVTVHDKEKAQMAFLMSDNQDRYY